MESITPLSFRFSQDGEGQWKIPLRSKTDTERLGRAIGRVLRGGEVIALTGELGAGKTCMVRGIAQGVGLSSEEVSSPTFTIIQEYASHPSIVHVDLYRLNDPSEIEDIGLSSYFDTKHVVIIEWADRAKTTQLPNDRLILELSHSGRYSRWMRLRAFGAKSQALLETLFHQES